MIARLKGAFIETKEISKPAPKEMRQAFGTLTVEVTKYRFISPEGRRTKWYDLINDDLVYDASGLIDNPLTISDLESLPKKGV